MIRTLLYVVIALFPASEVALAILKRSKEARARSEDRGTMAVLWLSIMAGVTLAMAIQRIPAGRIPASADVLAAVALAVMLAGLALRWAAILTLGRFFTVDVALHDDHAVVDRGLYRYVRHPSYTGLLVAFLGFGIAFGSYLSILVMLVPITLGLLNRVRKEERALLQRLGPAYAAYCGRTRRFIPGLW